MVFYVTTKLRFKTETITIYLQNDQKSVCAMGIDLVELKHTRDTENQIKALVKGANKT